MALARLLHYCAWRWWHP